jgi:hypothetical protein
VAQGRFDPLYYANAPRPGAGVPQIDLPAVTARFNVRQVEEIIPRITNMRTSEMRRLRDSMGLQEWRNVAAAIISRARPADFINMQRGARDILFGRVGTSTRQIVDDITAVQQWATAPARVGAREVVGAATATGAALSETIEEK